MDAYTLFQEYLQIDHQVDEFYHTLAQGLGLSDSALWVLWGLVEQGEDCTQSSLCRQFFLSKQTVHSSVRKLEQDGFLSLRPKEGREVSLVLTERPDGGGVADADPPQRKVALPLPGSGPHP